MSNRFTKLLENFLTEDYFVYSQCRAIEINLVFAVDFSGGNSRALINKLIALAKIVSA